MTTDRPSAPPYNIHQRTEPRLDDWSSCDDFQGLTPPREFDGDLKAGVEYTPFHGQFLTAGPPTPPRTEAHSSPTRSPSSSPDQLDTSTPNSRPQSADGITMTHDGDVIMSGNWAPSPEMPLPFGLVQQSQSHEHLSGHMSGFDMDGQPSQADNFEDLVDWDAQDQSLASTPDNAGFLPPTSMLEQMEKQNQLDQRFMLSGGPGMSIKLENQRASPAARRKRSRDENDTLLEFNPSAPLAMFPASVGGADRTQKLIPLRHGCVAAGIMGSFMPEQMLEIEWPVRAKFEGNMNDAIVKSRVETQIQIQFIVSSFSDNRNLSEFRRLRLPRDTVSKVKYLDDSPAAPDMLDLEVKLVCASHLHHPGMVERLFYEGRGEKVPEELRNSTKDHLRERMEAVAELQSKDKGSEVSQSLDTSKINAVHICQLCVKREKKRAARKKTIRKQEEEEQWGEAQDRRVISFNTAQIIPLDADKMRDGKNAVSGETNIRICCYCRHHHEKEGFRVLFNVRNSHTGKITAQTLSGTILITDDHKNSRAEKSTEQEQARSPAAKQGMELALSSINSPQPAPSHPASRRGSQGTEMSFASTYSFPNNSGVRHRQSGSSQPPTPMRTSPSPGLNSNKRRKPSKVPAGLTMTRSDANPMESSHPVQQFVPDYQMSWNTQDMGGSSDDAGVVANPFAFMPSQSWNMPLPNNHLGSRHFLGSTQLCNPGAMSFSPQFSMSPSPTFQFGDGPQISITHCVPSEGSCSGGYEATILGQGFVRGMTVMFGDTPALSVDLMSEGTLLCVVPPSATPGPVVVHFKSVPISSGGRLVQFKYKDEVENELMALAMRVVGMKMMGAEGPASTKEVALRILRDSGEMGSFMSSGHNGRSHGHQQLERDLLACLDFIDMDDSPYPAKLNYKNRRGQTLLHLACRGGYTKFAAALIARGVKVNARDRCGYTPLHYAAMMKQNDIIRRLLHNRADPAMRTKLGDTPADLGGDSDIVRYTRSVQRSHSRPQSRSSSVSSESRFATSRRNSVSDLTSLAPLTGVRNGIDDRFRSRRSVDDMFPPSSDEDSDDDADDYEDSSDAVDNEDEASATWAKSRRGSVNANNIARIEASKGASSSSGATQNTQTTNVPPPASQAAYIAWVDTLRDQVMQGVQNLHLTLPTMPGATDYQIRLRDRMAGVNLPAFPNPFNFRPTEFFQTHTTADPPAYNEIFPDGQERPEIPPDIKDATETVATPPVATRSLSVQSLTQCLRTPSPTPMDIKELQRQLLVTDDPSMTEEKRRELQSHVNKLKRDESDRRLYFIWLPLLLLMLTYAIYSYAPSVFAMYRFAENAVKNPAEFTEYVKSRFIVPLGGQVVGEIGEM
ncbi:hypothetical protein EX30DRAFT_352550 [Ascodesmis nigricans]|uniref:Uncharacterized protein n=1 Tax=Ascodesmis nigricans TaxID=341454 RepID=A0A4S2MPV1_9PEZI|nr:hypothetical protein EX30DRAFT_352550 [Ascodesmis nigricans]